MPEDSSNEIIGGTPFNQQLIQTEFGRGNRLLQFENNPEVIIRKQQLGFASHETLLRLRAVVDDLNTNYHIHVPKVEFVVAHPYTTDQPPKEISEELKPDDIVFTVTERIHGQNLEQITFTPTEAQESRSKFNEFFRSLIRYHEDKMQHGGEMLSDIERGDQFVYGRRKGETEDNIYIVDIDFGETAKFVLTDSEDLRKVLSHSLEDIGLLLKAMEVKLGGRLEEARAQWKKTALRLSMADWERMSQEVEDLFK